MYQYQCIRIKFWRYLSNLFGCRLFNDESGTFWNDNFLNSPSNFLNSFSGSLAVLILFMLFHFAVIFPLSGTLNPHSRKYSALSLAPQFRTSKNSKTQDAPQCTCNVQTIFSRLLQKLDHAIPGMQHMIHG